ncbi:hypothetical protein LWI28_028892 [Acer negundo]|uniref:EF-hand domain-containing protein n=1 Tax=Acer negundo TaxID=4023 RepID=A0AAD5P831_ACENE|nr:hypothetical protein LWI28_028892 [Acer negundo]KAK4860574.1 hypothetical protein QYF36_026471 [Acer negundo]
MEKGTDRRLVRKLCDRRAPVPYTQEQLRGMFWRYDTNKDGKLSRKELKDAFNYLGASIPGWRAHRALHHADDNGDGYISEEEVDELINYAVKLGYVVK